MTAKTAVRGRPDVKIVRPVRFRRDRLEDIDAAAAKPGRDASQFIRFGADLMLGSIRCGRCDEAVPLEFGDIRGKDMWTGWRTRRRRCYGRSTATTAPSS